MEKLPDSIQHSSIFGRMSFSLCAVKAVGELNNPLANSSSKIQFLSNYPVLILLRHRVLIVQTGVFLCGEWADLAFQAQKFLLHPQTEPEARPALREGLAESRHSRILKLQSPCRWLGLISFPGQHRALLGLCLPGASQGSGKADGGSAPLSTQGK